MPKEYHHLRAYFWTIQFVQVSNQVMNYYTLLPMHHQKPPAKRSKKFCSFIGDKTWNFVLSLCTLIALVSTRLRLFWTYAAFFSKCLLAFWSFTFPSQLLLFENVQWKYISQGDNFSTITKSTSSTASEIDWILSFIFKGCAATFSSMCIIFYLILKTFILLDIWEKTFICPIFKKCRSISNYRQITLLCCF